MLTKIFTDYPLIRKLKNQEDIWIEGRPSKLTQLAFLSWDLNPNQMTVFQLNLILKYYPYKQF